MPDYKYLVIDPDGKEKKGTLTAQSYKDASSKLKNEGNMVVSIDEATILTKDISINIGKAVKARDLSIFCRQFIAMVNAGVTILDALNMLAEQTENRAMAKAIKGVHAEIQKGETLADSLRKYPDVFPHVMVSMVAAGEASGKLDVAFERMSIHFEKSAHIKGIVRKAAIYPIIVAIVSVVVVVVMLVKVIPSYQSMFDELGGELPAMTKAVVALSNFVINYWPALFIVLFAFIAFVSVYKTTESGKSFFGELGIKAPFFGKLIVKSQSASFARTLSTLIISGLPMIEALGITATTMSNYLFEKAVLKAKDEVSKGVGLSEPLKDSEIFPPMVTHMVNIGEETGDLEGMLNRLAEYYEEEVEISTETAMAALEPMIILVLAVIVGILIAAIMSAMLALYGQMDAL